MEPSNKQPTSRSFGYELAHDVVALLKGEPAPEAPAEIPEWFCRGVDRKTLRNNWGAYALNQFAVLNLSHEQWRYLKQLNMLDDLGSAFFHYITNDKAVAGGTKQPIAVEILRAKQPPAMLVTKFHAYLHNDTQGPFPRSAEWKLRSRFEDILTEQTTLFKKQNHQWTLTKAFQPTHPRMDQSALIEYAQRTIGELEPVIARNDESQRADKLISSEDATNIAETMIRYAGPLSSSTLARLVTECWAFRPWHDEAAKHSWDTLYKSPDTVPEDTDEEAESLPPPLEPDPLPPPQEESEEITGSDSPALYMPDSHIEQTALQRLWQQFPPRFKAVLACDEAVTGRPYTLVELEDWTRSHPGAWGVIKRSAGSVCRRQLIDALREQLTNLPDQTAVEHAYAYFLQEARKLHQVSTSCKDKQDVDTHER